MKTCEKSIENVDFVKCKLCSHKGLALYTHVKKHNLTIEEYEETFGPGCCKNSLISISLRNSITQGKSNYRNKLKKEGKTEELKEFNKKVAVNVSETILSNEQERKRRSELLGSLNKTEQFRKKASETAIKTSARKDTQLKRSQQLKKWRDENPEEFYEKCLFQMHKFKSLPEGKLFLICENLIPNLKRNQYIKRKIFSTLTNKKQIDCLDIKQKIIIEFDGELHFFKKFEKQNFENTQKHDNELNSLCDEFCIIRVGYDQFSYRKSDYGFKKECLDCLEFLIKQNKKGLYKLGEAYGKDNILQNNWKTPNL